MKLFAYLWKDNDITNTVIYKKLNYYKIIFENNNFTLKKENFSDFLNECNKEGWQITYIGLCNDN